MRKTFLFLISTILVNAISVQTFHQSIEDNKVKNNNEKNTRCVKYFMNGIEIDMCYEINEDFINKAKKI